MAKGLTPPLWVDEAGLERHLALILHDHPYIWLQEQKVAQAERKLSLYTYNIEAPPYKVVESGVQQERNNLYALKEEVRKGVPPYITNCRVWKTSTKPWRKTWPWQKTACACSICAVSWEWPFL